MSHMTYARVDIVDPDLDLLREALGILAKQYNASVVENYVVVSDSGEYRRCLFGIPVHHGLGFGINIEGGRIAVYGDAVLRVDEFSARLRQVYVGLAVFKAAREMGFTVSNVSEVEDSIIIDLAR